MNRKQHIKTLESIKPSYHNVKQNSIQYAIDHLSREWVSRKHHRKLVDTLNKDRDEWQKKAIDRKAEIDELKADKDRIQGVWNQALRKEAILIETRDSARKELVTLKNKFIWLSISTIALLIALLISLVTR